MGGHVALRLLTEPIQLQPAAGGHRSWGGDAPRGQLMPMGGGDAARGPQAALARVGWQAQIALGQGSYTVSRDGQDYQVAAGRLLTDEQCRLIYQRTADVRAAIDQVVRRVATHPWWVLPTLDPSDPEYETALEAANAAASWLMSPNGDQETWLEWSIKVVTDLLVYDRGVSELVSKRPGGMLTEMTALRGADVWSRRDDRGRLLGYAQGARPIPGSDMAPGGVELRRDQVLMLNLCPNTEAPDGFPLLESLVWEVITLLRTAESTGRAVDYNEIPPGILFVVGLADDAIKRMRARFEDQARDQQRTLSMISSPQVGVVDAKWINMRPSATDTAVLPLSQEIRRAVWRVFGVMPVEMGQTEATPRATAQVQLDAGSSHLLVPILLLLQAKFNALVLPRVVPAKWQGRIGFGFDLEQKLTAAERLERAQELTSYVEQGILSRNEVREELGHQPDPDGDELMVGTQLLSDLMDPPDPVAPAVVDPAADPAADPEEDPPEDPAPERGRGRRVARRDWRIAAVRTMARLAPVGRLVERAALADLVGDLPSAWQSPGRYDGVRTLDLPALWEEVAGYARDVDALWEAARADAIEAAANELRVGGDDAATRASARVADVLTRLGLDWYSAVTYRYDAVAMSAHRTAESWTGPATSEMAVLGAARAYRDGAMTHLAGPDGPLVAVAQRVSAAISTRGVLEDLAARLAEVANAFDAFRHRIGNWAGRLVELGHLAATSDVEAGAASGKAGGIDDAVEPESGAVDWWVEWSYVGDERTCSTCMQLGRAGFMRLSSLPTMPGGNTECRARCRCVLVYWTRDEIDSGRAQLLGPTG